MATTILGPYSQFEAPAPLVVTFQTSAGVDMDIGGYDAVATWKLRGETTVSTITCSIVGDGSGGEVSVPWGTADPSPFDETGTVEMDVWVGDGTVRYASERFRWRVRAVIPTTAPAV